MSTTFSILLLLFGTLLDAHAHANLIISNVCGFFVGVYRSAIQTSFILHGKCFYIHRCDYNMYWLLIGINQYILYILCNATQTHT